PHRNAAGQFVPFLGTGPDGDRLSSRWSEPMLVSTLQTGSAPLDSSAFGIYPPDYPAGDSTCGCSSCAPLIGNAAGVLSGAPSGFSDGGVRYADGVLRLNATDLSAGGFGTPWCVDRSWTNNPAYFMPQGVVTGSTAANGNLNGAGWIDNHLPYLLRGPPH